MPRHSLGLYHPRFTLYDSAANETLPQCNRVETDDALAYCRLDSAALVSDSGAISGDADTMRFGSAAVSSEIETSILLHY